MFLAIGLLGFVISGLFPTLSAFGVAVVPNGPVNALATSSSYVRIAVVSPLVGVAASVVGIEQALAIPLVLVCLTVVIVALTRKSVAGTVTPILDSDRWLRTAQNVCQPPSM